MILNLNSDNSAAIDRLMVRLRRLQNPDATPLMVTWMRLIVEDNRRGVLAGLDKHGIPMAPVTYRPVNKLKPAKLTRDQKLGITRGKTGRFGGLGPMASGLHNNLTSAEYRQLGGQPLAPRGPFSRVITNLKTEFYRESPYAGWRYTNTKVGPLAAGAWVAMGYWDEVVADDGTTKFLKYHFHGIGQKRRDLTGVRPDGVKKAKASGVAWMRDMVRSGGV